jgi:hypothetical protein
MVLALLLSLAPAVTQADDLPPSAVRVQINHEEFTRGDRARVYVEAAQDGHLLVLHADPEGRVRVLFPLDPSDDDFVRAGKRREIRGRSDRSAFFVDASDGAGTVLAVLSPDPFTFDAFVRNDHWDFRALGGTNLRDDPLAGLFDLARRMAGETRFEYDVATYVVGGRIASHYGYGSGYYGYGYPSRFGFGLSFGSPWGYDPFCYDPFWGWRCGSRFGGFGYSSYYFGRPYYYQPYRYSRYTGAWPRGFGGSRFVMPRDRVRVTGIQPRSRVGVANPGPTARGSRERAIAPRGTQPRARGPAMSPRGGSSRGPSMSPRGGSSRGPSVSRPSNGSRGRSQPSGGTRSGGSRGSGGGGRRH